jgi:hypothetical protein
MDIRSLGVRSYERIAASSDNNQVDGTVMILRRGDGKSQEIAYPPTRKRVEKISYTDFRDKLLSYRFFSSIPTPEQRREYLLSVSGDNKNLYLSDMGEHLYVKFESISFCSIAGKKRTPMLDDDTMRKLLMGNPDDPEGFWKISYVFSLFPRKPGSKAARHVLVFRPGNWRLLESLSETTEYHGFLCHAITGQTMTGSVSSENFVIHKFPNIAVVSDRVHRSEPSTDELVQLAMTVFPASRDAYMKIIRELTTYYTPSFYKSLMQKIIRYRPLTVEGIDSRIYLLATFIALYLDTGSFSPDLQRLVTGKESALKRLAVTIVEDSYVDHVEGIQSLLAMALLAREKIDVAPSIDLMTSWMKLAIEALISTSYYVYDTSHMGNPFSGCEAIFYLLSAIGSFKSDIRMMGSVSGSRSSSIECTGRNMPISHAVDHHCYSYIAWFADLELPYPELFNLIWTEASRLNPRKYHQVSNPEAAKKIREAQELLVLSRQQLQRQKRPIIDDGGNAYTFSHTLDDSYIAALVGMVERGNTLALILPNDVNSFTAVKKPSTNDSEDESYVLTEEEHEQAVSNLKSRLFYGIAVTDEFIDKIYYRENEYWVEKSGVIHDWVTYKHRTFSFPLHAEIPDKSIRSAILYTGDGVEVNADRNLEVYASSPDVVRRLLVYTEGLGDKISPYSVNKKGKGTEYSVSPLDSKVYQLLAAISVIYPAAIEHSRYSGFNVKNKYFLLHIVGMLKQRIVTSTYEIGNWIAPIPDTRPLRPNQVIAMERLNRTSGREIIWMAAGMGKTAICTTHISNLITTGKMPVYCLYTLPSSAVKTVTEEFTRRGITHVLIDDKITTLPRNCVSILNHDHLYKTAAKIRHLMSSCLLIVDEMHKALNKTLRTSAALELAVLSHSFIAMTGTIYKDDKVENLISWLQLLSPSFKVTHKNYWVAISGIIAVKCDTGIVVTRLVKEEPLSNDELVAYRNVTPQSMGGTARNIDFRATVDLSYRAITRAIIRDTVNYLNRGQGVFVVAKDASHVETLERTLRGYGVDRISVISRKNPLSLTPGNGTPFSNPNVPYVVIAPINHCEGYDMTVYRVMVTGVYFSNQATREQIERRINRISQTSKEVIITIIHAGIISYIQEKYGAVRGKSMSLEGFAKKLEAM